MLTNMGHAALMLLAHKTHHRVYDGTVSISAVDAIHRAAMNELNVREFPRKAVALSATAARES